MKHSVALVVHGHFYQPPRDNPWVGLIERQDSARPNHDWNERIAAECYTPNAFARILDDDGRIIGIVNGYEYISFNFGPTLLAWLETHAPPTYRRILEADRRSLEMRGHGNAIAQAYNHAILPLCNDRDRRTQIRWGLADFEARFGRRAEAMWLPETAINADTLESLIDEGMRFVILSPHQAESARGGGEWFDVSSGSVDPTQPYRLFGRGGRHLDCFFYDGPISNAIGFQNALSSSRGLLDRLQSAVREDRDRDQIIHVATDGETYGHHTAYGERTLAYALAVEAPRRGLQVTNYGAYLAAHPPTAEAQLKSGPDGEGTAWSCSHGIGRWVRDCGCSAGTPGWNQSWRDPLRHALDLVRDRCGQLFATRGAPLLHDPWAARDAYAQPLDSFEAQEHFLEKHAPGLDTDPSGRMTALRLLEMERYTQLMYTSCGWFFDEISGLEGQQVLRYAARAMEYFEMVSGEKLEPVFLALLAEARSNLGEYATGAEAYRKLVAPSRVGHERLAAQEAILSLFVARPRQLDVGDWHVRRHGEKRGGDARFGLITGRMSIEWRPTSDVHELAFAVLHVGAADVCCAVRPYPGAGGAHVHRETLEAVWREWPGQNIARLLRAIEKGFGAAEYTVRDLLLEERERVLRHVYGELLAGVGAEYARLYDNHRHTMHILRDAGLPIPEPLRQAAEMVLGARFEAEIARQRRSRDPARYRRALEMAEDARKRGLTLQRPVAERAFTEMLGDLVTEIGRDPRPQRVKEANDLLTLARRLDIDPVSARTQEALFELATAIPDLAGLLQPLATELGFGRLNQIASSPHADASATA
jgi:alpha-amylase/alpha-mannosidase (GH57 family)